ncbi:MAG: dihydroorotate dehydrogenase [Planctomycetota bacterium]|jgi:dihydroorotate dehydrogenase (NAD+) catalytic subunit
MTVLATNLCGVPLRNPLIAASGTAGYGPEIDDVVAATRFGAITTKSITPESREGNPPWRVTDLPAGMLNAIGLANLGLARFVDEVLPALAGLDTVMIGSIAGHRIDDYVEVAAAFGAPTAASLRLVELNVSCPNTATGRLLGSDPVDLASLVGAARAALGSKPMLVKLSPGESDVAGLAVAAVRAGADGLTVANTYPAMSIDPETRRSRIGRASGGMSGPAVHPIAVKLVHDVRLRLAAEGLAVPIVGLGGVQSWSDAAEFVLAGATGIGIGTGLFVDPGTPKRIVRGLEGWVRRQEARTIGDLVGGFES